MWLFTGIMIYDSISNYAISVDLGHFTGLFTGIIIYDAISVISQGQCMID